MNSLTKVSKFFFFKTHKEKLFILKNVKRGNIFPFLVYILYRLKLTNQISVVRKFYRIKLSYSPYALWLYFHKDAIRREEEFVNFFLDEGDIFVDAGAHIGTVSLTASQKVGFSGKVIALEPHPQTFSYLKENSNLSFFKNITLLNVAVTENEGVVHLSSSYVSDMNHVGEEGVKVNSLSLKHVCEQVKKVSLLKLDVEGFELQALRSFGKDLHKVEAVLFESSPSSFARYGYTLKDIIIFLELRGYAIYQFLEIDKVKPISSLHVTKTRYEDLLALTASGKRRFQKKGGKILLS